jgi:hypothetical protein
MDMYFPGRAVEEVPSFSMSGWWGEGVRTEIDSVASLEDESRGVRLKFGVEMLRESVLTS